MNRSFNRPLLLRRRAAPLAAGLLILGFVVSSQLRVPRLSGKPISYLIAASSHTNSIHAAKAQRVLQDNIPQIVKFLLDEARAEDSDLHHHNLRWRLWAMLPARFRNHLPKPLEKGDCLRRISSALRRLGPAARPAMLKALEDPNENVRWVAASSSPYLPDDLDAAVAWQTNLLRLADYDHRQSASPILSMMGTNAYVAIPAILHTMQHDKIDYIRQCAAWSLARLSPGISPELAPKIRELMQQDTIQSIRVWSAITLWKMQRDPQALSLLIAEFNKGLNAEDFSHGAVLTAFGEAGPLAEPAVPAIQEITNSPGRFGESAAGMSNAAAQALSKIRREQTR